MTAMPPTDQMRAEIAAEKFVRQNMTEADLVSIMRYNGASVDILQDFTGDRNRILSILETLVVGEGQGDAATSSGRRRQRYGRGVRTGRLRVQHLHDGPPTGGAADGGRVAVAAEREEGAALLCQRPEPERPGQPGATACHRGCGDQGRRVVLGDRRAWPWWRTRRWAMQRRVPPGGAAMYAGEFDRRGSVALPAIAGHPIRAGGRYRRQGLPRLERPEPGNCAGAEGGVELLHHRVLHVERCAEWEVPQDQGDVRREYRSEAGLQRGLFCGQGVGQVQHRGQGASTGRRADAGRSLDRLDGGS